MWRNISLLIILIGFQNCDYFQKLTSPLPPNIGSLDGMVKERNSHQPIPEAEVIWKHRKTRTNREGYYLLEGIKIGLQEIIIRKVGYEEKKFWVKIKRGIRNASPPVYLEYKEKEIPHLIQGKFTLRKAEAANWMVIGQVKITPGACLTIEPGVKISFLSKKKKNGEVEKSGFEVEGELIAHGNSSEKIIFTSGSSYPRSGDWKGLSFFPGSRGVFKYTRIEYAEEAFYSRGAKLEIENCEINQSLFTGIYLSQSALTLKLTKIENTRGNGIYWEEGYNPEKMFEERYKITQNVIRDNSGNGIVCTQVKVDIEKNTIEANGKNGIEYQVLRESQPPGSPILPRDTRGDISLNNIVNNGWQGEKNSCFAVKIGDGSDENVTIFVSNCYIAGNDGRIGEVVRETSNQRAQTQCQDGVLVISPREEPIDIYRE
jgi:hypothetical protein